MLTQTLRLRTVAGLCLHTAVEVDSCSSNHASRGWGFPQGSELACAFGRQAKKSRKSDGAKVTGVFAS